MEIIKESHREGRLRVDTTYRKRIMFAVPAFSDKAWQAGKEYAVSVLKLWNGKFAIFKAPGEKLAGYKVYPTEQALALDFNVVYGKELIDRQEIKL